MEINNISQVPHRFCNSDAMTALELDMMLENDDDKHTEYLLLSAQFRSVDDLSPREAMRLALLERQFGEAHSDSFDDAETGLETAVKNGTARTTENDSFSEENQSVGGDALADCLAHTFAPQHTPHKTPVQTPSHIQEAYQRQSESDYGRAAPKPRRTRGPQKLTRSERLYKEAIEAMNTLEGAHEFSLGFSIGQEGSFMSAANPAQLFQKRVHRFLKEAGLTDVAFAFAFDVNKDDKLHAHGSIVFRPDQEKAVKLALRKAGGIIKERGAAARQLKLTACDPNRDPTGWLKYTTIYRAKVKKLFAYNGVESEVYCNSSVSYRRKIR